MSDQAAAVAEPLQRPVPQPARRRRPKRQPRYHVILWDDNDHTHIYVIAMMQKLFGYPVEKGYQIAQQVDAQGRCIVLTTTMEHAELKRDQIHAFGKDQFVSDCAGAMWATIEAATES